MPTFVWTVASSPLAAGSETALTEGPGAETLPKDLQLADDGDLLIEANDLVLCAGAKAIEQDLSARLRTIRGEWFLDSTWGLPYFEDLFGVKPPNLNAFRAALRAKIESTPGILEVTSLDLKLDPSNRLLGGSFHATTDFGELAAIALNLGI